MEIIYLCGSQILDTATNKIKIKLSLGTYELCWLARVRTVGVVII